VYTESGGVADYKMETLHVMDDTTRVMLLETELDPTDDTVIQQAQRHQYTDHLGTATLELDEYANVISYEEYYPFGSTSFQTTNRSINQKKCPLRVRDESTGLVLSRRKLLRLLVSTMV
jgi:hypothetical protein